MNTEEYQKLEGEYRKLRKECKEKYKPEEIKVLFIAESPPAVKEGGKMSYFYLEDNPGSEVLFATLVEALYYEKYRKDKKNKEELSNKKKELLNKLKKDGYFLIDAVECPINKDEKGKGIPDKKREKIIKDKISELLKELERLISHETKIILIKNSVFNVLHSVLKEEGYNVLNETKIAFPVYNCQDVVNEIRRLLKI